MSIGSSRRRACAVMAHASVRFTIPGRRSGRAEPGDTIHIAAGTYYGRLDRSSWIVECPRITVLGGYFARLHDAHAVEDALPSSPPGRVTSTRARTT